MMGESVMMSLITNIWEHPKTSAAGLLISLVTVASVLSQQGITLGEAGRGTVVTLVGALASALLGLLARDPDQGPGSSNQGTSSTQKLGVWMLIALLLPLPFLGGCSERTVAQDIVNWTPALQSAVATVDSTAALLTPADEPLFIQATVGFDAASDVLVAQAKAYLANPSASTLTQMQQQIVVLQQQVNAAVLRAARIVNPASQQHALASIQAVSTVVNAILSLIQSASSRTAIAQMATAATVKISAVQPYIDRTLAEQTVAAHYGVPVAAARMQMASIERAEINAGF
jgi:hypothetical protein